MSVFDSKHYRMTVSEDCDRLEVEKHTGSEWVEILMVTNEMENGHITLRSEQMAEQLWFMLGQVLGKKVSA